MHDDHCGTVVDDLMEYTISNKYTLVERIVISLCGIISTYLGIWVTIGRTMVGQKDSPQVKSNLIEQYIN